MKKIEIETIETTNGVIYKFSDNPNHLYIKWYNRGKAEQRIREHFLNGKDLILSDIATIVN